jgi:hypothetical protein
MLCDVIVSNACMCNPPLSLSFFTEYFIMSILLSTSLILFTQATAYEDARGFSKEKFGTTFEAIWRHSIPASHTLVFHYTSYSLALIGRKSGILAQARFGGVPLSLRQPHATMENDFDVFDMDLDMVSDTRTSASKKESASTNRKNSISTPPLVKKFPHEEVLVLSLPRHLLDPLPGYEEDDGLCMISADVLNALRPTSFTAVVDSQPWLDGLVMLPPQCILRSFLIMELPARASQSVDVLLSSIRKESRAHSSSSSSRSYSSDSTSSMSEPTYGHLLLHDSMMDSGSAIIGGGGGRSTSGDGVHHEVLNSLHALELGRESSASTSSTSIANNKNRVQHPTELVSIEEYIQVMTRIRQSAKEKRLVPLYHYTSPNVASLILKGGLRMSTQGQGDGGVYVSTLGPASYGLGSDEYEGNIIKDCFGVERFEEYIGKGKLDVIIIYGCAPDVLQQVKYSTYDHCPHLLSFL